MDDLFDQSPCGHVVTGLEGVVLLANPAFLALAGLSGIPHGRHFQQLLTGGSAIFYETQFTPTLLLRGTLKEISLELLTPSRERVPVFVNAVLRRDSSGKPSDILIAVFEATQRRLYEAELLRARRESERMAEVVRRSSDAIVRLTPEGVMQSWNHGAEQIFGISQSDATGKPLRFLFAPESHRELEEAVAQLSDGVQVYREFPGFHISGRPLELSLSMTPHLEPPGVLVAFSAIIRDITARRLSEKALLQAEKLASVGRLASSIAHEINNPLESVTNLLYILESNLTEPDSHALVVTAQQELARVSHIVTHTLRFHKQSTNRTQVDLATLCDSVLAVYRARLKDSGICTLLDSSGASSLLCFEGELRQIMVNLVSNSFDAMRSGGNLTLRNRDVTLWRTGARGVRITIADTGSGIDPATLERIFEPFFSTKGIQGTGLGLWIVQELVHKNGGHIKIRSNTGPLRRGTVVSLFFPHAQP